MKTGKQLFFLILGWMALGIGCLGIVLPILPSTPFILLAAYCFSKGDPRLYRRLLDNKIVGPLICDWQKHRVIRLRAKILSTVFIVLFFGYTLVFVPIHLMIKGFIVGTGIGIMIFIWTRPSYSPK